MAIQNTLEGASPESRGVYRLKSIILVHLYNLLSLLLILPYIPPFATHLVAVVQFSSAPCFPNYLIKSSLDGGLRGRDEAGAALKITTKALFLNIYQIFISLLFYEYC